MSLLLGWSVAGQCADYFPSKIYNNDNRSKTNSTFTVLGITSGFDLAAVKRRKNIKNIFVIINGQQEPCGQVCSGEKSDKLFGRRLTGGHRTGGGSYQVYLSHVHNSLAGALFDRYGEDSIIIDVLNPKYNWRHTDALKKQTEHYLRGIIHELLQSQSSRINLFISGFSRGGLLAYKLAQDLKDEATIRALVTIDPVINPLSSDARNVVSTAHYKRRDGEWALTHKKLPAFLKPLHYFPVLKNPRVPAYNVFQRQGLFSLAGGQFGKPIGSAIDGALSPCKTEDICALFHGDTSKHAPFDQYDSAVAYHSPDMPQKYANWVLDIALKTMPHSKPAKPEVVAMPVKPVIWRVVGKTSLFAGDELHLYWRSNQGGLEYQHSLTLAGKKPDWGDWHKDSYSFTYTLYDEGHYVFSVRAKNKAGDVSPVKSTLLNIKPRPPHIRYLKASDRVATPGMTISFQWSAAEDDLDYKIKFIKVGKAVLDSKDLHAEDEYKVTLYEQGDYVFRFQAFTKKGTPSRVYSRVVTVTDYIYLDEILIGSPPANPPADPYDPSLFNGVYAIARLEHRPEESKDRYWEGRVSITTPDWEKDRLFRSPWAIEKSIPARKELLKVGQTIVYSGWNPANPSEVRASAMVLAVVDDLSRLDDNIVIASWPDENHPSRRERKKLYLHNIRICLKPVNCLPAKKISTSSIDPSEWKKLLLQDQEGHLFHASSQLKPAPSKNATSGRYAPFNLFDQQLDTCWAEGADDNGQGQILEFNIPENTASLNIANGHQKSTKLFAANNRVKKLKRQLLLGINKEGEVTETSSLFHVIPLDDERVLTLQDKMGMQSLDLQLDWDSIKEKARALVQQYSNEHSIKLQTEYILRFTLIDTYTGTKYNDTCISEIKIIESHPLVKNIYLNNRENALLIDTDKKKSIVLDKDESAVFQIIDTTQDKQWLIAIIMPADTTGTRTETQYVLYNTWKKMKFTTAQLGQNFGELYDFESSNGQQLLNFLNTSTGKVATLNLESIINN